jgi:hypothetical protein
MSSVSSWALVAYLGRHGVHRTFAGLSQGRLVHGGRPDLLPRPRTVGEHRPQFRIDRLGGRTDHRAPVDNDPFAAGWRANAAHWLWATSARRCTSRMAPDTT